MADRIRSRFFWDSNSAFSGGSDPDPINLNLGPDPVTLNLDPQLYFCITISLLSDSDSGK